MALWAWGPAGQQCGQANTRKHPRNISFRTGVLVQGTQVTSISHLGALTTHQLVASLTQQQRGAFDACSSWWPTEIKASVP